MFRIKFTREIILKILFQLDLLNVENAEVDAVLENNFTFFKTVNSDEKEFITKVVKHVMESEESINAAIAENLIGWKLERLAVVDRNILRMGIGEAEFNEEKAVIIDDAVRIAKKYGEEDSYKIVNAILDKVIR